MLNASAANFARVSGLTVAELAQLRDELAVMRRVGHGGDAGRVARGRPEQRRPADVDHLDRLVQPDDLDPDRRCERLDVDDDEVDQADPLRAQLLELGGDVAPGQDPGIDRVVEGLDLAADVRLALREIGDGRDLDALGREVLARAVRGVHLDVESEQVPREHDDAIPIRHRQQGSHPGVPPDPVVLRRVSGVGRGRPRTVATAPHQSGRVYRLTWHTPGADPHANQRPSRDPCPLGIPLHRLQPRQLPGHLPSDLDRLARAPGGPRRSSTTSGRGPSSATRPTSTCGSGCGGPG